MTSVWKSYPQVSRDVGSSQDPSCRREKDGEHRKKVLIVAKIWNKILGEDFCCEKRERGETSGLDRRERIMCNEKCASVWSRCLTVIIEKALGFLFAGRGNDRSYKHVHYGHQQDNE